MKKRRNKTHTAEIGVIPPGTLIAKEMDEDCANSREYKEFLLGILSLLNYLLAELRAENRPGTSD